MIAAVAFAADAATKTIVRASLSSCTVQSCRGFRFGPLWIVNATNTGGAFSLRSGSGVWALLAFLGLLVLPLYGRRLSFATARARWAPLAWVVLGVAGTAVQLAVTGKKK